MLPTVAREVLSLCQSSDVDAAKLSEVLHRDQSLAGHVLRMANSPLYRPEVPIVSLQQAVSRLGLAALSDMAITAAVQGQLFGQSSFSEIMVDLWRHSLAAGMLAKEVTRMRRRNVESAFLCGLLHDVGKPVILGALEDRRNSLRTELSERVLEAAMEEFHTAMGGVLAHAWQLPTQVEECIRFHHDYAAAPTAGEAAMMTHLADHLAYLVVPHPRHPIEEDDVRSLEVLEALNLYPDEVETLFASRDKVREAVGILH